jgi:hypothetical protein
MAPLEEAGQPVVIGGVVIEHEDQKVGAICILIYMHTIHCDVLLLQCAIRLYFNFLIYNLTISFSLRQRFNILIERCTYHHQ